MGVNDTIHAKLDAVFDELDTLFDLPKEQRAINPQPDRWNIDEILEHTYLTNYYLLIIIRKGVEKTLKGMENLPQDYIANLNRLETVGVNGSFNWIRPEHMEPKGEKTTAEVRQKLRDQQAECHELLQKLAEVEHPRYGTTMTVNGLGRLNMQEWIYFIAMHAKRHIEQARKNLV